jgi:hypothetical protein
LVAQATSAASSAHLLTAWAEFDELLHQRSHTFEADALSAMLIKCALHSVMPHDVVMGALNKLE